MTINRLLFLVLSVEDSYRVAIVEDKWFLHHSRVQKNLTKQKRWWICNRCIDIRVKDGVTLLRDDKSIENAKG